MSFLPFIFTLIYGFLPILIYIIVEAIWGMATGLIVAILFALAELLFTRWNEGKWEKFILFDVALLTVFGLLSLGFDNPIFFKLKPAIFQVIIIALVAVTLFTRQPILLQMGQRYFRQIKFDESMINRFKKILVPFFWLLIGHTLLIVYAAFYLSQAWWAFISGALLYIMLGGAALIPLGKVFWQRYRLRHDEWFDLVDEQGRIIGHAPRSLCHGNPGLLHAVVHLHALDSEGRLFLQLRSSDKDVQPGKWDTSVGGHIHRGETVKTALKREAEEELGLTRFAIIPLARYVMRNDYESELVWVFRTVTQEEPTINPEEIADGRFWELSEIEARLDEGIFTPNFVMEYRFLKQNNLLPSPVPKES